jgi:hypothetical protein
VLSADLELPGTSCSTWSADCISACCELAQALDHSTALMQMFHMYNWLRHLATLSLAVSAADTLCNMQCTSA